LISTADFKNGISIILDNVIYTIVEFQHVKPGKGGAFVRTKLKNIKNGNTIEKTFRSGEKMEQAILDRKTVQYLYSSGDAHVFMDQEDFDQMEITDEELGSQSKYLKENLEVMLLMHDTDILGVELPITMELEVTETDPGLRGDTASGGSKPATVETGAVVNVPLFINIGDKIKVDTRTDSYLERVKN
jgi:elongation factor P